MNATWIKTLRGMIGDLDAIAYSDAKLWGTLLVAARFVQVDLPQFSYPLDLEAQTILKSSYSDEAFSFFTVLKAAALLDLSALRESVDTNGVAIQFGSSSLSRKLDTSGFQNGFEAEFRATVYRFKADSGLVASPASLCS